MIGGSYTIAGLIILAVVWLPLLLRGSLLTLPIFAVACGIVLFWFAGDQSPLKEAANYMPALTRAVLIFAVMESGLSIDRRFTFKEWASTWRLLGIVMPLNIAAAALLAMLLLSIPLGPAVVIGAILAPTDPVLASSVGLGPPGTGEQGEVRFALTSEAGLNDGLAFPFLLLGLAIVHSSGFTWWDFGQWLLDDFLAKVAAGAAIGAACGLGLVYLNRHLPQRWRLSESREGLAVLGVMFFVYGCAELANANGLVAVFVSGLAIRQSVQALDYTQATYAFAEQLERLLTTLILILFGGMVLNDGLPDLISAKFLFALIALFAIRPLAVFVGFIRSRQTLPERVATGYFGIRGLGTLFYLFYARGNGASKETLNSVIILTVLISIVVYGVSGDAVMSALDRVLAKERRD